MRAWWKTTQGAGDHGHPRMRFACIDGAGVLMFKDSEEMIAAAGLPMRHRDQYAVR
jgi:hypothetical protein